MRNLGQIRHTVRKYVTLIIVINKELFCWDLSTRHYRRWPRRQELPAYDARRALLARDPLACALGFEVLVGLAFRHIFGLRFCPRCPDCAQSSHPCMDAFGSNATAGAVCLAALMPSTALWSVRRAALITCTGNSFCNVGINSRPFKNCSSSAGSPCWN